METITIKTINLATTSRPSEFKGTIALDNESHDDFFGEFLKKYIQKDLDNGYIFKGIKGCFFDADEIIDTDTLEIKFILSKEKNNEIEYCSTTKKVGLKEFLSCFTLIDFQFSIGSDFTDDSIDWVSLKKIDK